MQQINMTLTLSPYPGFDSSLTIHFHPENPLQHLHQRQYPDCLCRFLEQNKIFKLLKIAAFFVKIYLPIFYFQSCQSVCNVKNPPSFLPSSHQLTWKNPIRGCIFRFSAWHALVFRSGSHNYNISS